MTDDTAPLVHVETRKERFNRKTSREPEELSSGSGGPKRMGTGCLRVSSVNALQGPSTRSEERTVESREVHIKHVLDTGAVKDWNNEDAIKTGAKILSRRSVDDAHKEKFEVVCDRVLPRTRTHLRLQQHRMLTTRR